MSTLNLLILILATMAWIYGASYQLQKRLGNLNVLVVDFDQGAIGHAVSTTAESFTGKETVSMGIRSIDAFDNVESINRAVCQTDFWAAVYINHGASEKLASALNGSSSDQDVTNAVTFVYNQARFPVVADSYLFSNLQALIDASIPTFWQSPAGMEALQHIDVSKTASASAYFNPIRTSIDHVRPMPQSTRALYNTFNIVIPPLSQFFLILALNGIGMTSGLLATGSFRTVWMFRFITGKVYGLFCGLAMTGCMWAYKEDWGVDGTDFVETWLTIWLAMDVNWQVMESIIGSFLPMAYTPFFVLPWIVTNIASTLLPVELMPVFYRVSYALPMRAAYLLLIRVWSGCGGELSISLPVLFAWWVVGHCTAVLSIRKRCHDAAKVVRGDVGSEQTPPNELDDRI